MISILMAMARVLFKTEDNVATLLGERIGHITAATRPAFEVTNCDLKAEYSSARRTQPDSAAQLPRQVQKILGVQCIGRIG